MHDLDLFIFNHLQQPTQSQSLEALFCQEDSSFLDFATTHLQSPLEAHLIQLTRKLAAYLLSDQGEIELNRVVSCIKHFSKCTYPLGPDRYEATPAREHILKMLITIQESNTLRDSINHLFLPSYPSVHTMIRETLGLDSTISLQPYHVKQAVLSALFSHLRQDVGSCFASALAIVIQQEYPERLIKDLTELLSTGKLSRTIAEQTVFAHMNLFPCIGELFKPIHILDLYPKPIQCLAKAPGLQKAFLATNILSPENVESQIQQLLSQEPLLQKLKQTSGIITVHDILQISLLHHFKLSEQEVLYVLLHDGLHKNNLAQHLQQSPKKQTIYQYIEAYEQACRGFTSTTQNRLLKCWEYTLATLAEANLSTTTQHLMVALGMDANEDASLAALLQDYFQNTITSLKELLLKCEQTYNSAKAQLDYIERRISQPINDQESKILSLDHIRFRQEVNQALNEWNLLQNKINKLGSCSAFLLSFYTKTLSQYFKSCYDPLIQEFTYTYTDAPSGFRILYTHGRSHPHTWEPLYSINEFIQALTDFFSSTERDLLEKHPAAGIEEEISHCIQHLIAFLHTPRFQIASINRILKKHNQPENPNILNHLETIFYTPWVYISGGTVSSLISNYFENQQPITQINKTAENAHELAAFFSDALKDLPVGIQQYLEKNHNLIVSSPTHTFSIMANDPLFKDAWSNDWYSYTWLRDIWVKKQRLFIQSIVYSQAEIRQFIETFCSQQHMNSDILSACLDFCSDYSLTIPEFYEKMNRFFKQLFPNNTELLALLDRRLSAQFVHVTPYLSEQQLPQAIAEVSQYLGISSRITFEKFKDLIEQFVPKFSLLSSDDFRHIYMGLLMKSYQHIYTEEDLYVRLTSAMRHHQLTYPAPLLFGDTNWAHTYFGFILHPGTEEIDLWQFNYAGLKGRPINKKSRVFTLTTPWQLFSNPIDYGMPPPPGYRSHLPKGFF